MASRIAGVNASVAMLDGVTVALAKLLPHKPAQASVTPRLETLAVVEPVASFKRELYRKVNRPGAIGPGQWRARFLSLAWRRSVCVETSGVPLHFHSRPRCRLHTNCRPSVPVCQVCRGKPHRIYGDHPHEELPR